MHVHIRVETDKKPEPWYQGAVNEKGNMFVSVCGGDVTSEGIRQALQEASVDAIKFVRMHEADERAYKAEVE